jgi:hypothetical protein
VKLNTSKLKKQIDQLKKRVTQTRSVSPYAKYRYDPVGYSREVLKVDWWAKQVEIAEKVLIPPHRVLVKACHSVGKSHLMGGLVNWWYDTRDPSVCITTAPNERQVIDIIWKEVRRQRKGRPGFPGPKMPRLESSESHFAHGFTASSGTGFQGIHELCVLAIIDEAVGVHREIWEALDSMVMGEDFGYIAITNPTDSSSEFYQREQSGGWHIVEISVLDHPNIAAELRGEPAPYPSAARLAWLQGKLKDWASPALIPQPGDIEWPPGSGQYLHPSPLADARLLGRWPSVTEGVWSDALWELAEQTLSPGDLRPEIGCDVARFGDDLTEYHTRAGPCSLSHEAHSGLDNAGVIGRLRQLCREAADWWSKTHPNLASIRPEQVLCKIDSDGMGGRIVDHANGYNWVEISASGSPNYPADYPNRRSELWFGTAEMAKSGRLSLVLLPESTRKELKRQAMAPKYKLDSEGRRVVEPKSDTKKKLGRSPDGMDAMNLAYLQIGSGSVIPIANKVNNWRQRRG